MLEIGATVPLGHYERFPRIRVPGEEKILDYLCIVC